MYDNDPTTSRILGCAYRVANELGPGFLEKVYENAFVHELRQAEDPNPAVNDGSQWWPGRKKD